MVRLKDINDNAPIFDKAEARVTLREDVIVGTLVEIFSAHDPDERGSGKVSFALDRSTDPRRHFRISDEGRVTVQRPLDRESASLHRVSQESVYHTIAFLLNGVLNVDSN